MATHRLLSWLMEQYGQYDTVSKQICLPSLLILASVGVDDSATYQLSRVATYPSSTTRGGNVKNRFDYGPLGICLNRATILRGSVTYWGSKVGSRDPRPRLCIEVSSGY